MKKTLALILALMMALCVFSACGKDEAEKTTTKTPEDTLNAYMECLIAGDDKALSYAQKDSEGYDTTVDALGSRATIKSQLMSYIGAPDSYEEQVSAYFDDFIDKAYKKGTFEIGNVEIEADKATAEVSATSPSYYSIESAVDNVDMAALIEENFSEGFEPETEEEADAATFKLMQLLFDEVLEDSSIYERETVTIELEKIEDKWVIVDIY